MQRASVLEYGTYGSTVRYGHGVIGYQCSALSVVAFGHGAALGVVKPVSSLVRMPGATTN
jgi:hypothetical protein